VLLAWVDKGTHIVIGLVAHRLAASQGLGFEQRPVSAVHADAVIGLEVPASGTLLGHGGPKEPKAEKQGEGFHGVLIRQGRVRGIRAWGVATGKPKPVRER
jgi:hypothetical protein